ncbi:MAG: serine/threonine-protein kinase [Myxococcales bacterium]|nr:serine/threonine protein kinase [Polyangiaceae bacterium]MDW8250991.1 serine/threonine-protein kinase [Myxococcales bacterium]
MIFQEGQILQSEYRLLHKRGASGQAEVWQAEDRRGRLVAIKAFREGNQERLHRESELLRRLRHPCLPDWIDFFLTESGPCTVLDWVQGVSLEEHLRRDSLLEVQKEAVLVQLAEVLAYLHEQRVTHRDLKPDNVMLTPEFWLSPQQLGTVKLIDLGIAVEAGNRRPLTMEQRVGNPWLAGSPRGPGSLPYMAPEMLEISPDRPEERADPRLDIFAFGVLGWMLFTGKHPTGLAWVESDAEVFRRLYRETLHRQRPWPEGVPGRFEGILLRCLQMERDARIADGRELLTWIQDSLKNTTTHEQPAGSSSIPSIPIPGPPGEESGTRRATPTPQPAQLAPAEPPGAPPLAVSPSLPVADPTSQREGTRGSPLPVVPRLSPGDPPRQEQETPPESSVAPRGVPWSWVAGGLGILVLAGVGLMAKEGWLTPETPSVSAPSPPAVSSPWSLLTGFPPVVSGGASGGASSPAPVASAPRRCPGGCGIWEICLQGRCDLAAKSRSLATCRISLPAGQGMAPYYDDEWLKGKPVGRLRDGFKLGSVRFHHERVLRVAVKGNEDHYLSPDVVICD